jgi:hypothetical protein
MCEAGTHSSVFANIVYIRHRAQPNSPLPKVRMYGGVSTYRCVCMQDIYAVVSVLLFVPMHLYTHVHGSIAYERIGKYT